jgi:hypothetical protein
VRGRGWKIKEKRERLNPRRGWRWRKIPQRGQR